MDPQTAAESRLLDLPPDAAGVLVVGDVHGHAARLAAFLDFARARDLLVVSLGDLVDRGPDPAGALRLVRPWVEAGRGLVLRANHELKLVRVLRGERPPASAELAETLRLLAAAPDGRALEEWLLAAWEGFPFVAGLGNTVLVHGAVEPEMLPPRERLSRHQRVLALFGEVSGRRPDGLPLRTYRWLDALPAGLLVIAGHDPLSADVLYLRSGAGGARLLHLDSGAGQGGPLSAAVLDREGRLLGTWHIRPGSPVPEPVPVVPWPEDQRGGLAGATT